VNGWFETDGFKLARYLALPAGRAVGRGGPLPGLIMTHAFPAGAIDARHSAGTFPELMDRIANELGWAAMTFTFRGCGDSEGDFSLRGWVNDVRAAMDHLDQSVAPEGTWLIGSGTGGSLAACVAADDRRVRGLGLLSARADFEDWAAQPRRFLEHARDIGAIRDARFPPQFDDWARELRMFRPLEAVRRFAPRPLLVIHGEDDDQVPTADARLFAQAHGSTELRVISGAGHRLRHDPRAVAMLLGWLDRQRNGVRVGL
jgi:putative redox protein